jgi:hypothetical protein
MMKNVLPAVRMLALKCEAESRSGFRTAPAAGKGGIVGTPAGRLRHRREFVKMKRRSRPSPLFLFAYDPRAAPEGVLSERTASRPPGQVREAVFSGSYSRLRGFFAFPAAASNRVIPS